MAAPDATDDDARGPRRTPASPARPRPRSRRRCDRAGPDRMRRRSPAASPATRRHRGTRATAPGACSGRRVGTTPDWTDTRERRRVAPDLLAPRRDDRQRPPTSSGISASRFSSSANRAASRQVTFGPLPPIRTGMPRRRRFGSWIASMTRACGPCHVARPGAIIRLMTSRWSARMASRSGRVGEAVPVCPPLVLFPAGADAELGPAAARRRRASRASWPSAPAGR